MAKQPNLRNTLKGSLLEGFYPSGWNLQKIDRCCAMSLEELTTPGKDWNQAFQPVPVDSVEEMDRRMGDAMADEIEGTARAGQPLAMILPVGPMGMYHRLMERLRNSGTRCDHVTTFMMDEWSDANGNTMPPDQPGSFQKAIVEAFFKPLGRLGVPEQQQNYASKKNLPTYPQKIQDIRRGGGRLVTAYGIGRACHIAFWEPQIAEEFDGVREWKQQTHRIGQALHPLTIEQNAMTSFQSRFTLIPCWANTIGPGLFLQSDRCIGGADGAYPDRGATWQAMSVCVTLQYGRTPWIPSTWMPTLPGELFFMRQLAGPLGAEAH